MRKASATLAAGGLAALVFASLWPVLGNAFTAYDDSTYVTQNPHVSTGLSWANAAWAFTSAHASNWHPLTWLSHQADVSLFGLTPAGPHFVNLFLHMLATALLFLWLAGLTKQAGRSAFVAASRSRKRCSVFRFFFTLQEQPARLLSRGARPLLAMRRDSPARISSSALFIFATMWKRSGIWRASEYFSRMAE